MSAASPSAPARKPSARERLLAAADELFYAEGVHTVGIDRVIERAGVAKASLYSSFGSKDGLIRAYLEGRHQRRRERILTGLLRFDTPRDRLLGVFDVLAELAAAPSFRGCAFYNASAESPAGGVAQPGYLEQDLEHGTGAVSVSFGGAYYFARAFGVYLDVSGLAAFDAARVRLADENVVTLDRPSLALGTGVVLGAF